MTGMWALAALVAVGAATVAHVRHMCRTPVLRRGTIVRTRRGMAEVIHVGEGDVWVTRILDGAEWSVPKCWIAKREGIWVQL